MCLRREFQESVARAQGDPSLPFARATVARLKTDASWREWTRRASFPLIARLCDSVEPLSLHFGGPSEVGRIRRWICEEVHAALFSSAAFEATPPTVDGFPAGFIVQTSVIAVGFAACGHGFECGPFLVATGAERLRRWCRDAVRKETRTVTLLRLELAEGLLALARESHGAAEVSRKFARMLRHALVRVEDMSTSKRTGAGAMFLPPLHALLAWWHPGDKEFCQLRAQMARIARTMAPMPLALVDMLRFANLPIADIQGSPSSDGYAASLARSIADDYLSSTLCLRGKRWVYASLASGGRLDAIKVIHRHIARQEEPFQELVDFAVQIVASAVSTDQVEILDWVSSEPSVRVAGTESLSWMKETRLVQLCETRCFRTLKWLEDHGYPERLIPSSDARLFERKRAVRDWQRVEPCARRRWMDTFPSLEGVEASRASQVKSREPNALLRDALSLLQRRCFAAAGELVLEAKRREAAGETAQPLAEKVCMLGPFYQKVPAQDFVAGICAMVRTLGGWSAAFRNDAGTLSAAFSRLGVFAVDAHACLLAAGRVAPGRAFPYTHRGAGEAATAMLRRCSFNLRKAAEGATPLDAAHLALAVRFLVSEEQVGLAEEHLVRVRNQRAKKAVLDVLAEAAAPTVVLRALRRGASAKIGWWRRVCECTNRKTEAPVHRRVMAWFRETGRWEKTRFGFLDSRTGKPSQP